VNFTRLPWRIGLPFTAFVVIGSVLLVAWTWWSIELEERAAFEKLALTNARFIEHMRLPASERMALQLGEVLGVGVHFRNPADGSLLPPSLTPLVSHELVELLPADGRCHSVGIRVAVAVPLADGQDLVMERLLAKMPAALWHRLLVLLAAFWSVAFLFAWLLTRGIVRPLRHLAAKLPDIEKPGPLDLPESSRPDEIGDVARSFVRTREALQAERDQREKSERMALLGQMAAALAHEIQNPVSAIKMHAQLLQGSRPDSGGGERVIEREAERIEGMVNQWMFLSRPEPPATSRLDVGALLSAALATGGRQAEHARVRIDRQIDPGLWVRGDQRRLSQVFANLISNAIDAMPLGGVLQVSAHPREGSVVIGFEDRGRGFSEVALQRHAEFFFSEKEGGMGIGLSVAVEIVKSHGGTLTVANRPEGGALVTVRLPVCLL
jgi:signal transduction histidine kinase